MFSLLPSISFLLIPNSLCAALADDRHWTNVFRAMSTWHKIAFLSGKHSTRTYCVYLYTHRCCFLNVCYFTTLRIKFTLLCYFPVTQHHEIFLNSVQTNCIFAALNYLVSSAYFIIYPDFHLILWIYSQYTLLCDSTRHPSTVKTGHIFLCFLSFTNLLLHMRILSFPIRLHQKYFQYASKLYQWDHPFPSVHPLTTSINFGGVISLLKSFVDHAIILNLSVYKIIIRFFIVASNLSWCGNQMNCP